MRRSVFAKLIAAIAILALALSAGAAAASETPWGRVRILGYKDSYPSDGRKFAPRAILQDVAHAEDLDLHLEYRYRRLDRDCRSWDVRVVNGHKSDVSYPGNLVIIFPYPSIWSAKDQAYWKWTRSYAERFTWYYTRRGYYSDGPNEVQPVDPFGIVVPMGHGLETKKVTIEFE